MAKQPGATPYVTIPFQARLVGGVGEDISRMSMRKHFVYVGFWRRAGVSLLDTILLSPIIYADRWLDLHELAFKLRSPWPPLLPMLVLNALELFFVVRYGGTLGKLILGMRIVNQEGHTLDLMHALRRDSLYYVGTVAYALLLWHTLNQSPPGLLPTKASEFAEAYQRYGGVWHQVNTILGLSIFVDLLIVAFNKRKRALHDFLAGSYVITKSSYDSLKLRAASKSVPGDDFSQAGSIP